jgi:hypothetical protein
VEDGEWFLFIKHRLAALNPQKYGKGRYLPVSVVSNRDWLVRCDSVSGWNMSGSVEGGWSPVLPAGRRASEELTAKGVKVMRGNCSLPAWNYFKTTFPVDGEPREASMYFCTSGPYQVFVNGVLIAKNPEKSGASFIDSVSGIEKSFASGENVIAFRVMFDSADTQGAAVLIDLLVDTTKHQNPAVAAGSSAGVERARPEPSSGRPAAERKDNTPVKNEILTDKKEMDAVPLPVVESAPVLKDSVVYRSAQEVDSVAAEFRKRESDAVTQMKQERLEIQDLQLRKDEAESRAASVKLEIEKLKKEILEMKRKKLRLAALLL